MHRFKDTLVNLGRATTETKGPPMGEIQDTLGQFPAAGGFSDDALVDLGFATAETRGIPVGDYQDTLGQYPTGGGFSAD